MELMKKYLYLFFVLILGLVGIVTGCKMTGIAQAPVQKFKVGSNIYTGTFHGNADSATMAINALNGSPITNLFQLVPVPVHQGFLASGFADTNYNWVYLPRFAPYITNITGELYVVFDYTNVLRQNYHFTNDCLDAFPCLTTNLDAPGSGDFTNGYAISQGQNGLADMFSPGAWLDFNGNIATTGYMIPTNFGGFTLVPVPSGTLTNALYLAANGNDATAQVGGTPFYTSWCLALASYRPFGIYMGDGVFPYQSPGIGGMPIELWPMQNLYGDEKAGTILSGAGAQAVSVSISNQVRYLVLLNGSQFNTYGTCPDHLDMENCTIIEYTGGSGDDMSLNDMTNCIFKNDYFLGYENAFQGAGHGTNIIDNCRIVGVSKSGDPQWAVPFYSSADSLRSTNQGWFVFYGDNSIDLDNSQSAHGNTAYCITCNQSNCVYDFTHGELHLRHWGGTSTGGIIDNTHTAIFLGHYWDNGTNMVCNGVPGNVGVPAFAGLLPINTPSNGQVPIWTNNNFYWGKP